MVVLLSVHVALSPTGGHGEREGPRGRAFGCTMLVSMTFDHLTERKKEFSGQIFWYRRTVVDVKFRKKNPFWASGVVFDVTEESCTLQSSSLDAIADKDDDAPFAFAFADRASGIVFSSGLIRASGDRITAQEFREAGRGLAPTLHLVIPSLTTTKQQDASSEDSEAGKVSSCSSASLPSFAPTLASPNSCLAHHFPPLTYLPPAPTGKTLHARGGPSQRHAENTLSPPVLRTYPTTLHTPNELPPLRHPTPRLRHLV